MDQLSRYYLKKANLRAADEYQDHIAYSDIDALNRATAWLIIAPVSTLFCTHILKRLQEDGGMSQHFRNWATNARAWSNSTSP
jgi:hypothetical protein